MDIFKEYKDILDKAFEAMENAYAPYSKYHVGACVKTKDGKYHIGANIENASYGLTNCAERSTLFHVYSLGYRQKDIESMALVTGGNTLGTPCGACRQVMVELLNRDTPVVIANKHNKAMVTTIEELLPYSFTDDDLK
ncbi:Cytidine deaminase [Fusobacterium sp. DD29]|jgi:cytidine deaminase|uniref:cytidine deaminase n=1 Tax=unclassified Fusobacterium TaxID=2648384 RepID=UPI001B8BB4FD|nr:MULTISPECIES: cytidine deaminase [unclassified Fusobacterium]MBR8700977.1 Cytidine deaminase [Fusobacterium sp. DD45]MBR8710835.1 Cytidine deaminase [Fusobacterium sp. DD28]MBR8748490.1 Cytidine deaminase [Fusobacterium sp. DD29]MBR8751310.1 Cytidine deaminase [Fusobacterium sp. DD26]MBR8760757.1 Cytidine deaminase [Fusobacterium sp. DD25]